MCWSVHPGADPKGQVEILKSFNFQLELFLKTLLPSLPQKRWNSNMKVNLNLVPGAVEIGWDLAKLQRRQV